MERSFYPPPPRPVGLVDYRGATDSTLTSVVQILSSAVVIVGLLNAIRATLWVERWGRRIIWTAHLFLTHGRLLADAAVGFSEIVAGAAMVVGGAACAAKARWGRRVLIVALAAQAFLSFCEAITWCVGYASGWYGGATLDQTLAPQLAAIGRQLILYVAVWLVFCTDGVRRTLEPT